MNESFTSDRVAIEKFDGTVVKERLHPAEHAEGKAVDTPLDVLDRAYFNGYALWTYLTTPFHFAMQAMSKNFPVSFPVSREYDEESGSLETLSTP
jgi:hypothetical protein